MWFWGRMKTVVPIMQKMKKYYMESKKNARSTYNVGRESVVDIATHYGLDGSGIESRWRRDFPHPSRPALGSTKPFVQWVPGFFPGGKAAGEWR